MLAPLVILLGLAGIVLILVDAFNTMVLPRSTAGAFRLTRLFYVSTWRPWSAVGKRLKDPARRERFLGVFGPLSLLGLLTLWALTLILCFGLIQWALGVRPDAPSAGWRGVAEAVYFSGTTFYTLGLGDVEPRTLPTRLVAVAEAGLGFAFLALVIGYLPVVYGAFSRRELLIARLDVRAGSPPSAVELLRHHHAAPMNPADLDHWLRECEVWSAELLEAHLSYPVLCLYRSQHREQSWLATLTTILDASALLVAGVGKNQSRQAPMTFAMARRAILDIAHIFQFPDEPRPPFADRLPPGDLRRLRELLAEAGAPLKDGTEAAERLAALRATYEPSAHALGQFTAMSLSPWLPVARAEDADCEGPGNGHGGNGAAPPESLTERLTSTREGATDAAVV